MSPEEIKQAITRLLALGGELAPPLPGGPRRKYELAHMRTLLAALGDPQTRFPSVLIAGTNGKGSTAATLASILRAAGHRVGLYTSPHLQQPNERIRIDGRPIDDAELAGLFLRVEAASAALVTEGALPYPPSFFETVTAIAFLFFAGITTERTGTTTKASLREEAVQLAVLEVGLGGRLDATNVVEPLVSVLTDISFDHQEWLGPSITAITREKAGILRQGGTLVTLPQHPEANQVIGEVAVPLAVRAVNAADYLPLRPAADAEPSRGALRNQYVLTLPHEVFGGVTLTLDSPLAGSHQQRNIALALATAVALHREHAFALSPLAIEEGVRATEWGGRLQLLHAPAERDPRAPVLLDAAHNPAGAWTLRAALSSMAADGPRTLVFACMADKAIVELAQILFPVFDEVLLTQTGSIRSAPLAELEMAAERTGTLHRSFSDARVALDAALAATPAQGLVVVAGSIPLLGQCRAYLRDWS